MADDQGAFMAASDLLKALGTRLFGSAPTVGRGTARTGFDASQLPLFRRLLGDVQSASGQLGQQISGLSADRRNALDRDINRQLEALRGIGQQEIADINQRYDARLGGARQGAASRGLYNTSVLPGMSALVDRERNRALGQARERQQSVIGGALGQRAQLLDRARQQELVSQLGRLSQVFGLQQLPAEQAGRSSLSRTRSTEKKTGLLSKLF